MSGGIEIEVFDGGLRDDVGCWLGLLWLSPASELFGADDFVVVVVVVLMVSGGTAIAALICGLSHKFFLESME